VTWRHIRVFIMPVCDMRFVAKGRIANGNQEPLRRLDPDAFLALLEKPKPDDDPPAAA
jgi:hypothetical protein